MNVAINQYFFIFFSFSFTGWVIETIMESIVRKRFFNKGFLLGPYVPIYGFGGFFIYYICLPFKSYPAAVFFVSAIICTIVEYITALLLEKIFNVKSWDYSTYPFTKWCHYKNRIALTTSLFFGFLALWLMYIFYDFLLWLSFLIPPHFLTAGLIFISIAFLVDLFFTSRKYLRSKNAAQKDNTGNIE